MSERRWSSSQRGEDSGAPRASQEGSVFLREGLNSSDGWCFVNRLDVGERLNVCKRECVFALDCMDLVVLKSYNLPTKGVFFVMISSCM